MLDTTDSVDAIDALLNPRSIAVIGASAALEKAGGRRWKTLVEGGFKGPLYPVHPKATEIPVSRAHTRRLREYLKL